MKNLLIAFILGLFAMCVAPIQSVAHVADKQLHAVVVTSQAGVSQAIAVPEVAALPYQLIESAGLLAYASTSSATDASTDQVTDASTDEFTDDPVLVTDTSTNPVTDASLDDPGSATNTSAAKGFLDVLKSNWAELLIGLLAFVKIFVRLTPTIKDDTVFGKLDSLISWIVPNLQVKK